MDEQKEAAIRALLETPALARLATTDPQTMQPHVVPVWFLWDGESVWISSFESTRKVKELGRNPLCAVLIEPPQGADGLQGVLFEGRAELIRQPRSLVEEMSERIYTRYMGPEGVLAAEPQSWIHDPENLLVRLRPAHRAVW